MHKILALFGGAFCAFALFLTVSVAFGGPVGSPTNWDATSVHKTGSQTMEGPLTMTTGGLTINGGGVSIPTTNAYCLDSVCANGIYHDWNGVHVYPAADVNLLLDVNGTGSVAITSGKKLCLDGTTCSYAIYRSSTSGGAVSITGLFNATSSILTGTTDVRAEIANQGPSYGGSIGFNDPIRNLSTTTALFESSTAATAGTDVGTTINTLNTLAGGDQLLKVSNNGTLAFEVDGNGDAKAANNGYAGGGTYTGNGNFWATGAYSFSGRGNVADGNSAIGTKLGNANAFTTAGAKIAAFYSDQFSTEKASVDKDGIITAYAVYGSLYDYESPTAFTLTNSGTYYQLTDTTVGNCQGLTCSATTDDISLPNEARFAGTYLVNATFTMTNDTNNQVIEAKIFVEGVGKNNCTIARKIATGADQGAASITCILPLVANDSVDIRFNDKTAGGTQLSIHYFNLNLTRLN